MFGNIWKMDIIITSSFIFSSVTSACATACWVSYSTAVFDPDSPSRPNNKAIIAYEILQPMSFGGFIVGKSLLVLRMFDMGCMIEKGLRSRSRLGAPMYLSLSALVSVLVGIGIYTCVERARLDSYQGSSAHYWGRWDRYDAAIATSCIAQCIGLIAVLFLFINGTVYVNKVIELLNSDLDREVREQWLGSNSPSQERIERSLRRLRVAITYLCIVAFARTALWCIFAAAYVDEARDRRDVPVFSQTNSQSVTLKCII